MTQSTTPAITGIDIVTYLVQDAERAIAFWRDTMGLQMTWHMEGMGAEFELGDGASFGLWKMEPFVPSSGVMFAVPDCKVAADYFRSKGVQIDEHVEESPICFMAFAKDSEGNSFILHQRKT